MRFSPGCGCCGPGEPCDGLTCCDFDYDGGSPAPPATLTVTFGTWSSGDATVDAFLTGRVVTVTLGAGVEPLAWYGVELVDYGFGDYEQVTVDVRCVCYVGVGLSWTVTVDYEAFLGSVVLYGGVGGNGSPPVTATDCDPLTIGPVTVSDGSPDGTVDIEE